MTMQFHSWVGGVVLCVLTATSWAQSESVAGNYHAQFATPTGERRDAKLVLAADGTGTWRVQGGVRSQNPCAGRETPVTVTDVTERGFTLNYHGSKVMSGCGDATWKLNRVDDKTLSGTMGDGRAVTFVKE